MTKQEYTKKESEKYYGVKVEGKTFHFDDGLSKGLEIAKEFLEYCDLNDWTRYDRNWGTWYKFKTVEKDIETKTTDELLTIFLTEKYGK